MHADLHSLTVLVVAFLVKNRRPRRDDEYKFPFWMFILSATPLVNEEEYEVVRNWLFYFHSSFEHSFL